MAQSPALPLTEGQLQLIGRVKALGVTPGQAARFVLAGGGVETRVVLAEAVVNATRTFRTSWGALAWDILNDTQDRYAFPKAQEDASRGRGLSSPRSQVQTPLLDLPVPEASLATVSILARLYIDKKELAVLTARIESGALDLAVVQKALVKAKASQTAEAYIKGLLT